MSAKYRDLKERMLANSVAVWNESTGDFCWIWLGARLKASYNTYGRINIWNKDSKKSVQVLAHRLSFETFVGPIPAGFEVDHYRCYNGLCVAPDHLRAVTRKENLAARR